MSEREYWQKDAPVDPIKDVVAREIEEIKPEISDKSPNEMTDKEKADLVFLHSMLQMAGMTMIKGKADRKKSDCEEEEERQKSNSDGESDDVAFPAQPFDDRGPVRLGFEELTPKQKLKTSHSWAITFTGILVFVLIALYLLRWFLNSVGF